MRTPKAALRPFCNNRPFWDQAGGGGAAALTSSTAGLVLSLSMACRYTARGLMVCRCRTYRPANATSAAAKACGVVRQGLGHRHGGGGGRAERSDGNRNAREQLSPPPRANSTTGQTARAETRACVHEEGGSKKGHQEAELRHRLRQVDEDGGDAEQRLPASTDTSSAAVGGSMGALVGGPRHATCCSVGGLGAPGRPMQ